MIFVFRLWILLTDKTVEKEKWNIFFCNWRYVNYCIM